MSVSCYQTLNGSSIVEVLRQHATRVLYKDGEKREDVEVDVQFVLADGINSLIEEVKALGYRVVDGGCNPIGYVEVEAGYQGWDEVEGFEVGHGGQEGCCGDCEDCVSAGRQCVLIDWGIGEAG